jgi:hypothetical protein
MTPLMVEAKDISVNCSLERILGKWTHLFDYDTSFLIILRGITLKLGTSGYSAAEVLRPTKVWTCLRLLAQHNMCGCVP